MHSLYVAAVALLCAGPALVQGRKNQACTFNIGAPVNTTSGMIIGHRAHNATQVSEYLGIPFAKPPVGQLRFAAPKAYTSRRVINATNLAHDCPQPIKDIPTFLPPTLYNLLSDLGRNGDVPEEDCLYLNVWSKPQSGSANKPVLVWIHGGGFNTGGTNTTAYSGQFWADTEDVVFVNFNYRLNIFGFPGAPDVVQNAGLLDQRLALEWVRDNIAAFGGDPTRITIFGQSAGGASVDLYNYAWTEDPIIAGSIAQSGTAISFGNKEPNSAAIAWHTVTQKLGCGNETSDQEHVLSCMRAANVTAEAIVNASKASGAASIVGYFGPTIDNKVVFENYTELASKGKFIQKPYLFGNNLYEAGLFALATADSKTVISKQEWDSFDREKFVCPAGAAAQYRAMADVPVWRYVYAPEFPNEQLPTSYNVAWHGAELLPMFGTSEQVSKQDSTWQERTMGTYMRGAWSAFAACPESGLIRYGWPTYSNKSDTLVQLGFGNVSSNAFTPGPTFNESAAYDLGCGFPFTGTPNR